MIAHALAWDLGMCLAAPDDSAEQHGDVCRRFSAYLKPIELEVMDLAHVAPAQAGRLLGMIHALEKAKGMG